MEPVVVGKLVTVVGMLVKVVEMLVEVVGMLVTVLGKVVMLNKGVVEVAVRGESGGQADIGVAGNVRRDLELSNYYFFISSFFDLRLLLCRVVVCLSLTLDGLVALPAHLRIGAPTSLSDWLVPLLPLGEW